MRGEEGTQVFLGASNTCTEPVLDMGATGSVGVHRLQVCSLLVITIKELIAERCVNICKKIFKKLTFSQVDVSRSDMSVSLNFEVKHELTARSNLKLEGPNLPDRFEELVCLEYYNGSRSRQIDHPTSRRAVFKQYRRCSGRNQTLVRLQLRA